MGLGVGGARHVGGVCATFVLQVGSGRRRRAPLECMLVLNFAVYDIASVQGLFVLSEAPL